MPILRSTTLFHPRERPPWWYNHNATIMTFVGLIVKQSSEPLTTVIRHPNVCLSFDRRCYFVLGSSRRRGTTIMPLYGATEVGTSTPTNNGTWRDERDKANRSKHWSVRNAACFKVSHSHSSDFGVSHFFSYLLYDIFFVFILFIWSCILPLSSPKLRLVLLWITFFITSGL